MFGNNVITEGIDAIIYFLLIKRIAYIYNSMSQIKLNRFEKEKK
jgi:hypothetical protein